ncbi:MAG: hypothetical protein JO333_07180 [Verrucomicrobia bacterium]|nr:hypothetical protein [Verrucomicrobiota bacterium]
MINYDSEALDTREHLGLIIKDQNKEAALLQHLGSIANLGRASVQDLLPSLPRDKAAQLVSSLRLAGVALGEERSRLLMERPLAVTELCAEMRFLSHKSLRVVLVNTKQEPIKVVSVSQGMLDEALAHPREVFKSVVAFSAFALVLVHNHPSGDPSPSEADLRLTRRILEAGKVIQLQLVDHVIVGSPAQALMLDQVKEKPLTRS